MPPGIDAAKRRREALPDTELLVEGTSSQPTGRQHLDDIKEQGEGPLVKLDGVGGTMLLVQAKLHREGLIFPTFVIDNSIETEGLARMAYRMGVASYGLTDMVIRHA